MDIIIITGMSGSGKSVALHALEDAGYYCVDNLPPELLIPFVKLEEQQKESRLAIAIDVRNAGGLYVDKPVVVDGNVITARKSDDIPFLVDAILKAIGA